MPALGTPRRDATAASVVNLRIDRREFAHDRRVWLLYAAIFAIVGAASFVIPLLWPALYRTTRLWPFAAALTATAVVASVSRPPRLDSLKNHLAMAHIS
ncbi:MAG: hypothetical protein REI11_18130, partial [Patulibacter sp.]|nr:hypothetical protein [Patulibacter sp.]